MTSTAQPQLPTRKGRSPRVRSASGVPGWLKAPIGIVLLAARGLWRVVGPVLTVVSVGGWIVLLIAVASLVIGRVLGWQEFIYLSFTLLAGLVCAAAFLFGTSSYSIEIELTPRRIVAGERALGRLAITSPRRRSTPTRLELPVGSGVAEFVIPALAPGEEHEELFAVPTNRRAVILAGPARSVRGDQLGLLRRVVRWAEPVELYVHPVTTPLMPSAAGLVKDLEGEVTKTITNSDISFHALRAYEPGDDRRYVHWRTSARTGQLMVRQFEETRRSQLALLFASDSRHYASDEEFELAVSIMASLGVRVVTDATAATIVTESLELRTRTTNVLLDDSCRIEPTPNLFATAREFARERTSRMAPPSVVIVVSGSRFPMSEFRAVQSLFGIDTQTLGYRAELGATSRLTRMNGMRVGTVGTLPDLPRLVRRST